MKKKVLFVSVLIFLLSFFIFPINSHAQDLRLFDVEYEPIGKTIVIKTSKELKPEISNMDNPPRVVIDFPSTVFQPGSKKIDVHDGFIKQIRISQFRSNPSISRVSVELTKHIDFEMRVANENDKQNVILTAIEFGNEPITIDNNSINKHVSKKPKNNIETFEFNENKLLISGKDKITYELNNSSEPDTYSLKLLDFSMSGIKDIPFKPEQNVENIRIEEINNNSLLTFKLKPNYRLSARPVMEGNKMEIVILQQMAQNYPVDDSTISMDLDEGDRAAKIFVSSAKNALKYKIFELDNPDRLVIDTFGTNIPGFDDPFSNKYSKFIQRVRFGYIDKSESQSEGIRIVLELKKKISYKENLLNEKMLEVRLLDNYAYSPSPQQKFLIVLDPGHGGNDPGAIGSKGAREKDVTLNVSYYVRQMLIDSGMAVLMARADDSEILLQPRVDVANNNKADLFVSVHCNAMDGSSPRGVETYFRTPQSTNLAKIIHKNMIETLGTPDRGIRVRNFFVIRKTAMPSVLIEIGYITNPTEEALLGSSVYQKKVASAIYKGIKEYLGSQIKI